MIVLELDYGLGMTGWGAIRAEGSRLIVRHAKARGREESLFTRRRRGAEKVFMPQSGAHLYQRCRVRRADARRVQPAYLSVSASPREQFFFSFVASSRLRVNAA